MNIFTIKASTLKFIMYLWPPLWFTGIRFHHISNDFRHIRMTMSLRFYNKNMYGIQFGGSLYSMIDPCHVIMVLRNLGKAYRSIDSGARIEFIKPGTTRVTADCLVTEADLDDIKQNTASGEKYFKDFNIDIKDEQGELVARVIKTIYVRKKQKRN